MKEPNGVETEKSSSTLIKIKSIQRNWISQKNPFFDTPNTHDDQWVAVQSASGVIVGGENDRSEIITVMPVVDVKEGDEVYVSSNVLSIRPSTLDFELAALIPFLAISTIPILNEKGISEKTCRDKTVVVIGGKNAMSCFAIQLMKHWGAKVIAVTTENKKKTQQLGAKMVFNFRKESFSDLTDSIDIIVDSLGDESGTLEARLAKDFNITYVCITSPALRLAVNDGILSAGSKLSKYNKAIKKATPDDEILCWTPNSKPYETLKAALDSLSGNLAPFPKDVFPKSDYFEALTWPTDSESGLRFGFPAKSTSEIVTGASRRDDAFDEVPLDRSIANSVREVQSISHLGNILKQSGDNPSVLFLSQSSCRACKFIEPHFMKASTKFDDVSFLRVSVDEHQDLAKTLGVESVPTILVFKDMQKMSQHYVNQREALEKILVSLNP